MSAAANGILDTIAWLHPEYAPLIDFVKAHEDTIVALAPVVTEAINEGPDALAAAERAAPDLVKAVRAFLATTPVASTDPKVTNFHAENVVRKIVGAPAMTDSDQAVWWSNNTGS